MAGGDDLRMRRLGSAFAGLMLFTCVLILAVPASASRKPTSAEANVIRTAAVHSLHGSGWIVSHIRVSTVQIVYEYASAAVDQHPSGVGGEMILQGRDGRWSSLFLGTNDFCTANAPVIALNDLGFQCSNRPRSCNSTTAHGLTGYQVRINSYVPGCPYGRRVISAWFGKGRTSRPVRVESIPWACGYEIGSHTRASCIAGKNGLIELAVRRG
jgi:hypothetical protein